MSSVIISTHTVTGKSVLVTKKMTKNQKKLCVLLFEINIGQYKISMSEVINIMVIKQ